MELYVSGPVDIPGDPYGRIVTFVVVKDGKRATCVVSADELDIPGTRFKIIKGLVKCLKN